MSAAVTAPLLALDVQCGQEARIIGIDAVAQDVQLAFVEPVGIVGDGVDLQPWNEVHAGPFGRRAGGGQGDQRVVVRDRERGDAGSRGGLDEGDGLQHTVGAVGVRVEINGGGRRGDHRAMARRSLAVDHQP